MFSFARLGRKKEEASPSKAAPSPTKSSLRSSKRGSSPSVSSGDSGCSSSERKVRGQGPPPPVFPLDAPPPTAPPPHCFHALPCRRRSYQLSRRPAPKPKPNRCASSTARRYSRCRTGRRLRRPAARRAAGRRARRRRRSERRTTAAAGRCATLRARTRPCCPLAATGTGTQQQQEVAPCQRQQAARAGGMCRAAPAGTATRRERQ